MATPRCACVDLYWIPLGAGGKSVRFNGIVYEAVAAALNHRSRYDLYHSALVIDLSDGRYTVEMTPVSDGTGDGRGVVVEGPVGHRRLGTFRLFRYELRRWRDGVVPDIDLAVESPITITNEAMAARRVFDTLPLVPALTWGRDELHIGDMWNCNSIISWALTTAGLNAGNVALPPR